MDLVSYMPPCFYTNELSRSVVISNVGLIFCYCTANERTFSKSQQPKQNDIHEPLCIDILDEDNISKKMNEENEEFCTKVKLCFTDIKSTLNYNKAKFKYWITPKIETVKYKVDSKTEVIKRRLSPIIKKIKIKASPLTSFLPVFISSVAIVLALSDQSTDGKSTYDICTAECRCDYVVAGSFAVCQAPTDICGSGWINGTSVMNHCSQSLSGWEDCKSKQSWDVPDDCRCYWEEPRYPSFGGTCLAPKGTCSTLDYNAISYYDYCYTNGNSSKENCEALDTLPHPDSNMFPQRHPYLCKLSLGFFIGPSLINNGFLLVSLLYNLNYKQYFIMAGFSSIVNIHWSIEFLVLSVMAILQILPYLCLFLKFLAMLRIYMKFIDEDNAVKGLKSISTIMNVVFSYLEDLPQLTIQMFVFLQAVLYKDIGIIEEVSWLVIAGLVTSLLSLSKNYTEYSMSLRNCSTSAVCIFPSAFIAAGGRVLICCLMSVVYDGYNYVEDDSATWRIFLPVASAIALQILVFLAKISIKFGKKIMDHDCPFMKRIIDSSVVGGIENVLRKQFKCANDLSVTVVQNGTNENESIFQSLYLKAFEIGYGIRSLLFSVTSDSHSHLGLWSCICYATWALWLRTHFLARFLYYPEKYADISKTALTLAMLSYVINSILSISNNQKRRECLIASVSFIIYPSYLYIMTKLQIGKMWYDLFIHELQIDDIIAMLNPIITVAGMVILLNTIALFCCKGNSNETSGEDHDIV